MEEKYGVRIIGYCSYCKEPVYEHEKYRIKEGQLYHDDEANNCYIQSQLYVDDFGNIEGEYE